MAKTERKPEPIENETGKQMDDNIDDLGRRPDGSKQEQPGITFETPAAVIGFRGA